LPYALAQELAKKPISSEAEAQAALAKIREIEKLRAQRTEFWPAAQQRDDLLGETLRGLASMTKPGRPNGLLEIGAIDSIGIESGAATGALKLLSFYGEEQPARALEIAAGLSTRPGGDLSAAVRAWQWVQQNKPANLLANGDLEGGANARGVPAGWTSFSSGNKAKFALAPTAGRHGSAALGIEKNSGNAVLIQKIPVEPGQKYLCTLWSRTDSLETAALGLLSFSFEPLPGIERSRQSPGDSITASSTPQWQPLSVLITVPDGMARLVIKPGERNLDGAVANSKLYLDDIALYRLPSS